ncbi:MAG: hypothetical protein UH788_01355 [Treponemataceae bacterium]|nr:hypothetical protein [Spirochaetaceae bacterium]MEE0877899.1 hypothetical protein [Treponemataceae bacterium]
MKFLQKFIFICFLLLIPNCVYGKSINILINQIDGIQDSVRDSVQLFENSVMDFFFDAGFIVSSEKICLETDIKKTVQIALDSSVNGFIDYLIVAKINVNPKSDELISAGWEVINVATGKTIGSGLMEAPKPYREKEVSIQRFGVDVGSEIYSCIKGN